MVMEEEGVTKPKSFKDEEYCNRRVFLRSYPLQWEENQVLEAEQEEEQEEEEEGEVPHSSSSLKGKLIALIHWNEGKLLLLRRIKNKMTFYLVSCYSFAFKSSKKLITL
ncbi:hypothetical protein IHE45_03G100400 [Dioscorea alata]|uniref:Uncharacterized protein n=1 Tax=Dioscorea alata TaxID=55571 RepID=A0ACB7WMU2_DIOAL|nr:hypothetical protein IHE45_03G100400 [Dioscorea alata]